MLVFYGVPMIGLWIVFECLCAFHMFPMNLLWICVYKCRLCVYVAGLWGSHDLSMVLLGLACGVSMTCLRLA